MSEKSMGVSKLTVNEMVDQLSLGYVSLIRAGLPLRMFPSVMLWGAPGVGKSQGVRQIAKEIEEKTEKKVHITDVRLLLFNPVDLRGIPTANRDKTFAVWLKPKIFQMDESADVVNILFLDEISAAPQSVQAAAYQITLDRTVGEHRLPENCIVIAAGNRVTDRSVTYNMPRALANRLCHMEIEGDTESWLSWAKKSNIHPTIRNFIASHPSFLMGTEEDRDSLAFPTPRSWEMVSNVLSSVSDHMQSVFSVIVGCIGERAAYELYAWNEVYARIPTMQEICNGKTQAIPPHTEGIFALCETVTESMNEVQTEEHMKHLLEYTCFLPSEFRNRLFEQFLKKTEFLRVLQRDPIFDYWFATSGKRWEDYNL